MIWETENNKILKIWKILLRFIERFLTKHCYRICWIIVDPYPIHLPTRLAILKVKGKAGFRVLKNSSQWRTVLFGVAIYFLFLFLNRENLSKNKNPSMTLVREKWYAKTKFWVRGPGYLSGRYLMRGSTPLGPKLGLY